MSETAGALPRAAWPAAAGSAPASGYDAQPGRGEAYGTGVEGAVRILAVAWSSAGTHGQGEAERAIEVGLGACRTMLAATNGDLDAAATAAVRSIVNRWRSGRPVDVPPSSGGTGTSLAVALAGRHGVRLLTFGEVIAGVSTDRGLTLVRPTTVAEPDLPRLAAEEEGTDDWFDDLVDPIGLDDPAASRQEVVSVRSSLHPSVALLATPSGPDLPGPDPTSDSAWSEALNSLGAWLHLESRQLLGGDADDEGLDPHGGTVEGASGTAVLAKGDSVTAAPVDEQVAVPLPDWLHDHLPEGVTTAAFTWPLEGQLAAARSPSSEPAAAVRPATVPRAPSAAGSGKRWLVVMGLALATLAVAVWAAWAGVLHHPSSTAPPVAPMTPTRLASSTPPATPLSATPTPSPSSPSPSESPSQVQGPTPTPAATRRRTVAPRPTPTPVDTLPAPTPTTASSTPATSPANPSPSSTATNTAQPTNTAANSPTSTATPTGTATP